MESIDRLREYIENAPSASIGPMARAILLGMVRTIEQEGVEERAAAYNEGYDAGFASADDWTAQHEDAMAEHGWVRLPVDADGVPIHVGDVVAATLAHGGSGRWVVDRMELTRAYDQDLWQIALDKDGACWVTPPTVRHHHEPTVEDVLHEFANRVCNSGHQWGLDAAAIIAEYAAKLRLAGDGE